MEIVGARVFGVGIEEAVEARVDFKAAIVFGAIVVDDKVVGAWIFLTGFEETDVSLFWCRGSHRIGKWCGRKCCHGSQGCLCRRL
jgi:hypothetical protein